MIAVHADEVAEVAQFEALYRRMAPAIRRYAVRTVGDSEADDVVSETFVVVWRRRADLPEAESAQRAWVFRVAHNFMAHEIRSVSRRARLLGRVRLARRAAEDPSVPVTGREHVTAMLALLPRGEREAMALVVLADMSPTQAAFVLGCSVSTISSRLTRARRRLEAHLGGRDTLTVLETER